MKTFTLCQKYIENCSVILWTLLCPKYLKYCSGYFGSSHWVYTADMKTVKTHYGKRAPLSAQLCAVHCSLLRCLQFIQPQFAAIQCNRNKKKFSGEPKNNCLTEKKGRRLWKHIVGWTSRPGVLLPIVGMNAFQRELTAIQCYTKTFL